VENSQASVWLSSFAYEHKKRKYTQKRQKAIDFNGFLDKLWSDCPKSNINTQKLKPCYEVENPFKIQVFSDMS
jgi:hypothetical protein